MERVGNVSMKVLRPNQIKKNPGQEKFKKLEPIRRRLPYSDKLLTSTLSEKAGFAPLIIY
ncbi:MAG: hypothetical protein ACFBSC_18035 [Microcoleaceae cyanobacterium]